MAEITNKLLKQAIADAEAVRETAVANAKLVLEEAITPQIRSMIARRLRVEAEMGSEEEKEDVESEKKPNPFAKKEAPEVKEASATEKPFQDADPIGGKDFSADSSVIGSGDNKEPSADAFGTSDIDQGGEGHTDSSTDWYDDWSDSDFDLDEVIKELEEDIAAMSEGSDEEEEEEEEEEESDEESEDSDEMEIEKEGSHMAQPAAANKAGLEKTDTMKQGMHGGMGEKEDDKELDLEAILAELEDDDDDEMGGDMPADDHGQEGLAQQIAGLKKELHQYHAVVNTLRERLQEVNLLNAKLLFTNKMFRNQGLNNEQKVRIVESFDRATTVREVKLVYTALVENLSTAAKTFNASRKKVVAEGFASKATPSTAPKKEVIVENTVIKRLQELAGINLI
jgi:hypothetical protein